MSRVLKEDLVVAGDHAVEVIALIKNLEKGALLYLDTICTTLLPFFTSGAYFDASLKRLVSILEVRVWHSAEEHEITRLANVLIVEFLLGRYHLNTIRKFPAALFDKIKILPNGYPSTDYPHNVNWRQFQLLDSFDSEAYAAAIAGETQHLGISDRVRGLSRFFYRPTEDGTVIFPISGLRNVSRRTFRSVTLYSPVSESIAPQQERREGNPELFSRDPDVGPVNVAVELPFRDTVAAAEEAADIAEELLDWMQPHWIPSAPVEIDRRNYIVLGADKRFVAEQHGVTRHNQLVIASRALDIDRFFQSLPAGLVESVVKRISEARADQPLARKLPVCLRWYRKAVEAEKLEDKLLYYWVVLERAFASSRHDRDHKWSLSGSTDRGQFGLIVEYVPVHEALTFMYSFGWQLYWYLWHLVRNQYISLSPEMTKACVFDGSSRNVTLDDFLPRLDAIAAELSDRLVKNKVEEVANFYRDPMTARARITKRVEITSDEIVLIYRLRNSIVHQGHFDPKLLEPFAARAGQLAGNVIQVLLTQFVASPDASVETIFAGAKVQDDWYRSAGLNKTYRWIS